ncbi:4628_t:CDS:2 [Paraglomus brasilianum]|uniref:4628_t:CDS:1 n=1 Tax=Paraglomus brasilianum TaxID=144538 RepID=A0A9N9BT18_9GLOM|nr:4628_t:CDS:2 [Paraglomus brasilianum]
MARLRASHVKSVAKMFLAKKSSKHIAQSSVPFGLCSVCSHALSTPNWCQTCQAAYFSSFFSTWSSSSPALNTLIQKSQLNAQHEYNYVEWINYDRIEQVELYDEGHFSVVYKGVWLDGPRKVWDEKKGWTRSGSTKVVMKALNDNNKSSFDEIMKEFDTNIKCSSQARGVLRCYGITKDPSTDKYMLVLECCANGSLRKFLQTSFSTLEWPTRLSILHSIISGIRIIHDKGYVHRDMHSGNVFIKANLTALVGDLGLCRSADERFTSPTINGVMPYVAPESLYGFGFSKASDIYAFGILMWELSTGTHPFSYREYNAELSHDICSGTRPRIQVGTPIRYMRLMQKCWADDPDVRPSAEEVCTIIEQWLHDDGAREAKMCKEKKKPHGGWMNKIKRCGFGVRVFNEVYVK